MALGVNIAISEWAAWPGTFPQRLLVIDEFGTFAGMALRDVGASRDCGTRVGIVGRE